MSLKEKINLVKQQLEINEIDTMALEKSIGKKLVDYDSIDALVAALMGYYNPLIEGISETFKNFCPFPIGSVLPMWNEANPTSLYLGTTWELISAGKYVQTGSTALATGGSNSITIVKANLPNIKLTTTSATASIPEHFHYLVNKTNNNLKPTDTTNYISYGTWDGTYEAYHLRGNSTLPTTAKSSNAGKGTTGSFTLQTEALGSGTPLNIQPNYITLKFWKRLS